jgi:hypothetical protein
MKSWLLAGLLGFLAFCASAELQLGEGDILWTENFLPPVADQSCQNGWRLMTMDSPSHQAVMISVEGGRARIMNVAEGNQVAMLRQIPLPPRVAGHSVFRQVKVTKIGSGSLIWMPANGNYITGNLPGIWTFPYRRFSADEKIPSQIPDRIDLIGRAYLEVEWMRLFVGTPPGAVIFKRDKDPAWDSPIKKGESLLLVANLGKGIKTPKLSFSTVSFNRFNACDLLANGGLTVEMRDDGLAGDETAGDGIWTFRFQAPEKSKPIAPRSLVARIEIPGNDSFPIHYGICPWSL